GAPAHHCFARRQSPTLRPTRTHENRRAIVNRAQGWLRQILMVSDPVRQPGRRSRCAEEFHTQVGKLPPGELQRLETVLRALPGLWVIEHGHRSRRAPGRIVIDAECLEIEPVRHVMTVLAELAANVLEPAR